MAGDRWSQAAIGAALTAASHPMFYVKVLIQVGHEPLAPLWGRNMFGRHVLQLPGLFGYARHITKVDGKLGLFRGLAPRLCTTMLASSTHSFVLQKYAEDEAEVTEDGNSEPKEKSLEEVVKQTSREMVARCTATIVSHPFHVISMRCMVQFIGREVKYTGVFNSLGVMWREEGIMGFFAGLVPRLLGDIISLWLCNILAHLINTYALDGTAKEVKGYTQAITGFFASIVTYPFVLVANLMAVNNCGLAGGSLPYAPPYSNWLACWSSLSTQGQLKRGSSLFFRKAVLNSDFMYLE
ncbi:mitochondrial carrier homolog 2 isoform X1 [Petromyzon marinus]|uniref:Mitochondrial carrier homolog 2 isoform X2 n=1 Tax=Petromyzon marinus TaxID=7757 RepID=A0AAJ7WPD6_PETMA|nr:mitochondrial carrier homolog 2 isoform X2 [Petromyzon marinus]